MATTKSTIITLLRNLLTDTIRTGVDMFIYTNSAVFTLSEPNTQTIESVEVNDVSSGVAYTYDSALQKVTVSSSLSVDDVVEINCTYYSNYSDTELLGYIRHALTFISINRYKDFEIASDDNFYPLPTKSEENLIATIAAIIINPENKSYKTPDFSVTIKNPMSTSDMIAKTIGVFKKNSSGIYAIM